jgi:hypothetical protein
MALLKIYAAQAADVSQGWVWLGGHGRLDRSVVKLSIRGTGKSVHCEALSIDGNFLREYNQPWRIQIDDPAVALVAAEWYRRRLGLETQTDAEIDVKLAKGYWAKVRACLDHPQVVVRLPTILGLWSVVLAAIGVALGIIALFKH